MPTTDPTPAQAVLRAAQLVTVRAKWRLGEEQALARLAACPGLACAPLFPEHPVIQVIAQDGRLLGRARLDHGGRVPRWVSTPAGDVPGGRRGHRTLRGAARGLARAAGMPRRLRVTCLAAHPGPPYPPHPPASARHCGPADGGEAADHGR